MISTGMQLASRRACSAVAWYWAPRGAPLVRRYSIATVENGQKQNLLDTGAHNQSLTHTSDTKPAGEKVRVVILGSGWAGYALARTLDPAKYDRIVISPRSYFVFTPLLASTAAGTLEFRSVLEPIRRLTGIDFYQGWADDIDFTRKTVRAEANTADDLASKTIVLPPDAGKAYPKASGVKGEVFDISYDKLVIACGSYLQTFGVEGVREHAHFLRDIGDARRIRLRVLSLFEQCSHRSENAPNPADRTAGHLTDDDRRSLLHFAIVGGGPTGIEYAAELHDLIYEDLARIYPDLLRFVSITVYDIAPKVLPMFDQALAKYATDTFARQGIRVRTKTSLTSIRPADGPLGIEHGGLTLSLKPATPETPPSEIGAGLVVWSTGLKQNPLIQRLASKTFSLTTTPPTISSLCKDPRTGGLLTDGHLRARITHGDDKSATLDDVFVIGDCSVIDSNGTPQAPLPKTAQVASQQAVYLAKQLNAGAVGTKEFKFRNWGTLTYLGGWKAIHQSKADNLRGWVAWILWRGAYLTKSMSLRNKIMVPFYWVASWLSGRDISRF